MINVQKQTMGVSGTEVPIGKWEVWYMTFNGLHESHESAVEACLKADLDPNRSIVPVPVAIDAAGRYEVASRLI